MILVIKVTIEKSYLLIHADPALAWWSHSSSLTSVLEEEERFMNLEGDSCLTLDDWLDEIRRDSFSHWPSFVQAQSSAAQLSGKIPFEWSRKICLGQTENISVNDGYATVNCRRMQPCSHKRFKAMNTATRRLRSVGFVQNSQHSVWDHMITFPQGEDGQMNKGKLQYQWSEVWNILISKLTISWPAKQQSPLILPFTLKESNIHFWDLFVS